MLFGLSLGLVVAIGVYLRVPYVARFAPTVTAETKTEQTAPTAPAAEQAAAPSTRREQPRSQRTEDAETRFEFYEILPQLEVVVPEGAPASAGRSSRRRPAETPGSFLLQAGSFSAAGDADRLQASLALLGFESHIQRVTLDDDVFNRVRIGPIADLDTAKRTQRQLRDAGIDTLLMQVPK